MATENKRMRQLNATEAEWQASNPVILNGEIAFSHDVQKYKVGNGVNNWSGLDYWTGDAITGSPTDGQNYGLKGQIWSPTVNYEEVYAGDLNNIVPDRVKFVRLAGGNINGWDGQGDGDYLLDLHDDDSGHRIQIGYSYSDAGNSATVIHTRVLRGTWSGWLTNVAHDESPFAGDLNSLATGSANYMATVGLETGASNAWQGPQGRAGNPIVMTMNVSGDVAMQFGIERFVGNTPAGHLWIRKRSSGVWQEWYRVSVYEEDILDLNRIRWRGNWVSGNTYEKNDMVLDAAYLSVANKQTTDRPAPQPIGQPSFAYQGTSPEGNLTAKSLLVGQDYSFPTAGFLTQYRIYGKAGVQYLPYYQVNDGAIVQLPAFTPSVDGWTVFPTNSSLLSAGDKLSFAVYMTEPDPTPTTFSGDWNYLTPNNEAIPIAGEIQHANRALQSLRINVTDDNGGGRGPELRGLAVGDIIDGAGTRWTITNITDNTSWMDFTVTPALQGAPVGVQTFTFETVTATPITTVIDTNYFQSNANITGFYGIDGGTQQVTEDAYGVDIEVQEATVSPDWDVMAISGGGTSGGGGGDGGVSKFTELSDTPTDYVGHGNKSVMVAGDESGLIYGTPGGGGATTFLELTDTPSDYTGSGGYLTRINSAETALEFIDPSGLPYLPLTGGVLTGNLTVQSTYIRVDQGGSNTAGYIDLRTDAAREKAIRFWDNTAASYVKVMEVNSTNVFNVGNSGTPEWTQQLLGNWSVANQLDFTRNSSASNPSIKFTGIEDHIGIYTTATGLRLHNITDNQFMYQFDVGANAGVPELDQSVLNRQMGDARYSQAGTLVAWAIISGAGVLLAGSGGTASLVATGRVRFTFDTAEADNLYQVQAVTQETGGSIGWHCVTNATTASLDVRTFDSSGAAVDLRVSIEVWRRS